MKCILDLCGGTGGWSKPYLDAGYHVTIIDPLAEPVGNGSPLATYVGTVQGFLAELESDGCPPHYHGVLAAPPCTEFAVSGSRWWAKKDVEEPHKLADAVETVRTCLQIIEMVEPEWWALENPVGRIRRMVPSLGKFSMTFNPCDYAGYADDPDKDAYTKRTCLWGRFAAPIADPRPITHRKGSSPIHRAPPSADRWRFRSATPQGFARAFQIANP